MQRLLPVDPAEEGEEADENAIQTVQILLDNGAIWNDLNKEDETIGCIALRLGQRRSMT